MILEDIVLNDHSEKEYEGKIVKEGNVYAFYPRYVKKTKKENKFCLKDVCEINKHSKDEIDNSLEYIEIGNLKENKIEGKLKTDSKTWRLAKEGDLLFPKLASSTWKEQVIIAKKDYKISPAIYTLTFNNEQKKKYVYDCLKENRNNVLEDIKSLSDGFKTSKLEITEFNLMNNV